MKQFLIACVLMTVAAFAAPGSADAHWRYWGGHRHYHGHSWGGHYHNHGNYWRNYGHRPYYRHYGHHHRHWW